MILWKGARLCTIIIIQTVTPIIREIRPAALTDKTLTDKARDSLLTDKARDRPLTGRMPVRLPMGRAPAGIITKMPEIIVPAREIIITAALIRIPMHRRGRKRNERPGKRSRPVISEKPL